MTRMLLIPLSVLFVVLCHTQDAEARWWAWLEKWSGPGPFRATGPMLLFTGCIQNQAIPDDPKTRTIESILDWPTRLALKPSPVSMNDAFHQRSEGIAEGMEAARQKEASATFKTTATTQVAQPVDAGTSRFLKALLANPHYVEELSPQERAQDALTAGSRLLQMYKFTPAPPRRPLLRETGPGHSHNRFVCGYFDTGRYAAEEDPRFPGLNELNARMYDFGPSARVHDGVDIGGGFGWVRFKGLGGAIDLKRKTFTPIRLILRPAVIALPDELREKFRWVGDIHDVFQGNVRHGTPRRGRLWCSG